MPSNRLRAVCGAACLAPALTLAQVAPPLLGPQGQLQADWKFVGLPNQKKPKTQFLAERVDGRAAVRIEADRSYGNWVHELKQPQGLRRISWSWRVEQPNDQADLSEKQGDDMPVRVCVAFDLPIEQLSFFERQKLQIARSMADIPLAAATLCYVWGAQEAKGSVMPSAFTRRLRMIVLRNGSDAARTWFDESRDPVADFLRAFADEARQPVPATAVLIGGDADNTQTRSVAQVADLKLEPQAKPAP